MNELKEGTRIESEHSATYKFIQNYLKEHGKLPPEEEVYKNIAKDHIDEIKDYYTRLKKMEQEAKVSMKKSFINIYDNLYVKFSKAKDISKLTKKRIIDKNGNIKTVYVRITDDRIKDRDHRINLLIKQLKNININEKNPNEVYKNIRKMAELNSLAVKGPSSSSIVSRNDEIYEIKNNFINKVLKYYDKNNLKFSAKTTIDGIVYFYSPNGHQISFHGHHVDRINNKFYMEGTDFELKNVKEAKTDEWDEIKNSWKYNENEYNNLKKELNTKKNEIEKYKNKMIEENYQFAREILEKPFYSTLNTFLKNNYEDYDKDKQKKLLSDIMKNMEEPESSYSVNWGEPISIFIESNNAKKEEKLLFFSVYNEFNKNKYKYIDILKSIVENISHKTFPEDAIKKIYESIDKKIDKKYPEITNRINKQKEDAIEFSKKISNNKTKISFNEYSPFWSKSKPGMSPLQSFSKAKKSAKEKKIEFVMKEFADGKLKSSDGKIVTDRKQALAIAYSEAEDMTKARITKYIKKYKGADGKWKYVYAKTGGGKGSKKGEDVKKEKKIKLESGKIYYNYRKDKKELNEEIIFASDNPNDSRQYGNYLRVLVPSAKTLDLRNNDESINEIIEHAVKFYNIDPSGSGELPIWEPWMDEEDYEEEAKTEDEIREEALTLINPDGIVSSAGVWDDLDFINYLYEETNFFDKHDGIITTDGAVFFESNKNNTATIIKLSEDETLSEQEIIKKYENMAKAVKGGSGKGTHKYYKKITVGGKTRYFYTKEQYQKNMGKDEPKKEKSGGVFFNIMNFFGFKDEKRAKEKVNFLYNENKTSLTGIDKNTFTDYMNEYLSNKEKWDKRFQKKEITTVNKKTGKIERKKTSDKKTVMSQKGKSWNLSLMKKVAGIVGGSDKKVSGEPHIMSKQELKDHVDKIEKDQIDNFGTMPEGELSGMSQEQFISFLNDKLEKIPEKKEAKDIRERLEESEFERDAENRRRLDIVMQYPKTKEQEELSKKLKEKTEQFQNKEKEMKEKYSLDEWKKQNTPQADKKGIMSGLDKKDYSVSEKDGMFQVSGKHIDGSSFIANFSDKAGAEKGIDRYIKRNQQAIDSGFDNIDDYIDSQNKLSRQKSDEEKQKTEKKKEEYNQKIESYINSPKMDQSYIKSLSPIQKGKLKKEFIKENYRLDNGKVVSIGEIINGKSFDSVEKISVPKIKFNRRKYNNMLEKEQKAYEEKLKETKDEYIVNLKDGTSYPISKTLYDATKNKQTDIDVGDKTADMSGEGKIGDKNLSFKTTKDIDKFVDKNNLKISGPTYMQMKDDKGNVYFATNIKKWEDGIDESIIYEKESKKQGDKREIMSKKGNPIADEEFQAYLYDEKRILDLKEKIEVASHSENLDKYHKLNEDFDKMENELDKQVDAILKHYKITYDQFEGQLDDYRKKEKSKPKKSIPLSEAETKKRQKRVDDFRRSMGRDEKTTLKKATQLLISELEKAKRMPIGATSKDGKRKKIAEGKWVKIKDEKEKSDKSEEKDSEEDDSYKMQHQPPQRDDDVVGTGYDLTDIFPDDIYSSKGANLYGHGVSYDQKAINVIQEMRNNPEKEITIYRAVPKNVSEIKKNNWVTITPEYAKEHGESSLKGDYKILSKKIKAKDLLTDGDSIHEWGYSPEEDKMTKATQLLISELEKAKEMPIGTINSSGYKKVAPGKWVKQTNSGKEKEEKSGGNWDTKNKTVATNKKETGKTKDDTTDKTEKKPDSEKETKTDSPNRERLKATLKKMASILAEALSGKDVVSPTGSAIEQAGENVKPAQKKESLKKNKPDVKK